MSLFAISDLHLSLAEDVNKPMDIFGKDWVNHEHRLRDSWFNIVSDKDVVVIPGDISWAIDLKQAAPDLAFLDSLPGKKVLVRGNHDYWWASMNKMRGLYKSIDFIQNDCFEGEDFVICGSRGWSLPWKYNNDFKKEENDKILARELLRLEMSLQRAEELKNGRKLVVAIHYPPLDRNHPGTVFTELFQKYKVDRVVYGHIHNLNQSDVLEGRIGGIDYSLVSFDRLDSNPVKVV